MRVPSGTTPFPRRRLACAGAAALLTACAHGGSTPVARPPDTAAPLRSGDGTLDAIAAAVTAEYLYRDRVSAILSALGSTAPFIPGTETGRRFADRVTTALQRASRDGHLYLRDDSARYVAAQAPPRSAGGLTTFDRLDTRRQHHGLAEQRILAGGIRYLRISAFQWAGAESRRAYDDAIAFLAGGDALIIDLRGNGGGSSEGPDRLLNAVLPPRTELFRYEGMDAGSPSRTGHDTQSGVLRDKPLYVLVDGHTGSAAEAFSYAAQQARVARIVGDPTFGAANNNREIPIAPRFMLSLSYRRPVSAVSGTNWEGSGVQPEIRVPAVTALAAAEVEALDRLAGAASHTAAARSALAWARVAAVARLTSPKPADSTLRRMAGQYGTSRLTYDTGTLRLTRADRPRWHADMRLIPLTADGLFAVEAFAYDDLRLRITDRHLEYLYGSEDAREVIHRDDPSR